MKAFSYRFIMTPDAVIRIGGAAFPLPQPQILPFCRR